MESVESSLKQMGENVSAVQGTAVPGLASWGQDKLDKCQDRWKSLSKTVSVTVFLLVLDVFHTSCSHCCNSLIRFF